MEGCLFCSGPGSIMGAHAALGSAGVWELCWPLACSGFVLSASTEPVELEVKLAPKDDRTATEEGHNEGDRPLLE